MLKYPILKRKVCLILCLCLVCSFSYVGAMAWQIRADADQGEYEEASGTLNGHNVGCAASCISKSGQHAAWMYGSSYYDVTSTEVYAGDEDGNYDHKYLVTQYGDYTGYYYKNTNWFFDKDSCYTRVYNQYH